MLDTGGGMKIALVYVFPMVDLATYARLARRFTDTYMVNPPGPIDHRLYVVANGSEPNKALKATMSPLPVTWLSHNNYGKDIGAFQMAAQTVDCDLMVCLGANVFFGKPGWLDYMVKAYLDYGPGLYGAWAFHQPLPHIRTTVFWMPPALLNSYPTQVDNGSRYEFEHGYQSILAHVKNLGYPTMMVSRRGVFAEREWHHVERDDCLVFDQHCESIGYR